MRLGRPIFGALAAAVLLCAALVSTGGGRAWAQGPPIHTDTPILLGVEGRGVRSFVRVVRADRLRRNGETISDPEERTRTDLVTSVVVPWNLDHATQVGARLPVLTRRLADRNGSRTRTGLGDAALFAKRVLIQSDARARTFRVALRGTAVLPTGDEDGVPPLGRGAFAFGAGGVAGWVGGRWGLYGEAGYLLATEADGVDLGDRATYGAAIGFRLLPAVYETYPSPQLNLYAEVTGTSERRSERDATTLDDTGGTTLFAAPGVQYVGGRRWLVEASVQIPVVSELNGTRLAPSWTATAGVRVLLL